MAAVTVLTCRCRQVECHGDGAPILTACCYCDDCQAAAQQIAALGEGPLVADPDGGTALCLIRNDRFAHIRGAELLVAHKLRPESPVSRMVASCCNSAMYLQFADGRFWVSAMRNRINGTQPAIGSRLATKFRDPSQPWPDDAARYKGIPARLILLMLGEWFKMKLSR